MFSSDSEFVSVDKAVTLLRKGSLMSLCLGQMRV